MLQQGAIPTDGAELYFEARGEGPPVLLIQGGVSEAGATEQLADALARRYQVITYDRRGLSRSTVSTDVPITMARHADDAGALLAAVATQPARVVGVSIGALIGLHLVVQHPDRVDVLVAHEPPMSAVVPDGVQEEALDTVAALARKDVWAAIRHMVALTNGEGSREEGARSPDPIGDLGANLHRFFGYDFPAVRSSTLDSAGLAGVPESTAIIPTGGAESRGQWEYRCASTLAHQLGRELVEMPGGHNGLVSHPQATAAALMRLFSEPTHENFLSDLVVRGVLENPTSGSHRSDGKPGHSESIG
ncbi:alpha/beta fold hydrolase [Saccharopolyspora phatthalungensis]|uniref:Pimeloyl-ACP methyl ester carboxylesterase n=1 Tax=Saccharopolyspora phatthalungensis TaxID=664693 RepID=A0A840QKP0_9PSEU|nr:alpha/beta hydrolase [Saccharopolyspora phatthalungensis]MBB5159143.1 pimeloyl-ACP methyl ester carboxylesterase [Saccharopolyspora phatthalungensis]